MPLIFILGAGAVALIAFLTFYNSGKKPVITPTPVVIEQPVSPTPAPALVEPVKP